MGACVVMPPWLIFYSFMGLFIYLFIFIYFIFLFNFFSLTLSGIIVVVLRVHACASLLATPLGMP